MTAEELKNVAGFKAVDAEGNELGVVSLSDIVSAVKQELQPSGVARASVAALSEVSAQAATDTYEDQLPQKTDVTWIRGLDESGNPILISKQSLVSVAEGLIGVATNTNTGLLSDKDYKGRFQIISGGNDDAYKVANLSKAYVGFLAVGFSSSHNEVTLFTVTRGSESKGFGINGTKISSIQVFKDSTNNIYIKIKTGTDATLLLISEPARNCMLSVSKVSLPSDVEEMNIN